MTMSKKPNFLANMEFNSSKDESLTSLKKDVFASSKFISTKNYFQKWRWKFLGIRLLNLRKISSPVTIAVASVQRCIRKRYWKRRSFSILISQREFRRKGMLEESSVRRISRAVQWLKFMGQMIFWGQIIRKTCWMRFHNRWFSTKWLGDHRDRAVGRTKRSWLKRKKRFSIVTGGSWKWTVFFLMTPKSRKATLIRTLNRHCEDSR